MKLSYDLPYSGIKTDFSQDQGNPGRPSYQKKFVDRENLLIYNTK